MSNQGEAYEKRKKIWVDETVKKIKNPAAFLQNMREFKAKWEEFKNENKLEGNIKKENVNETN